MHKTLLVASAWLLFCLSPGTASGQTSPDVALVLVRGDEDAPRSRVREFATHAERAARRAGHEVIREPVGWAEGRVAELGTLMVERVAAFRRVERLIVAARANTAGLMESRALDELATANQIAQAHADVPGAAAWIAEVQTAMGITASQAGLDQLAADAFKRAATLDPSRGVRAAEAPPEVAETAAEILAAVARRPRGSFQVRASAPDAVVFLDDREIGSLPRIVRAPVGTHVLRVEAPGRSPWGQVIDVLEGRRPPVVVSLAPDPLVVASRRLSAAVLPLDASLASELRRTLGTPVVWMARVGGGEQDRALLVRCTEAGCEAPQRLSLDQVPFVLSAPQPADEAAFERARRTGGEWLSAPWVPPPPPPPTPWWERWYVWVGVGAILAGAIAGIVVAAQPDPIDVWSVDPILTFD